MTYLDLEERPVVVHVAFPAALQRLPGELGTPARAKIFLTHDYLYVWTTTEGEPLFVSRLVGGPDGVRLRSSFAVSSAPNEVDTEAGLVRWVAGRGCACGDLRGFRPFRGAARSGPR